MQDSGRPGNALCLLEPLSCWCLSLIKLRMTTGSKVAAQGWSRAAQTAQLLPESTLTVSPGQTQSLLCLETQGVSQDPSVSASRKWPPALPMVWYFSCLLKSPPCPGTCSSQVEKPWVDGYRALSPHSPCFGLQTSERLSVASAVTDCPTSEKSL